MAAKKRSRDLAAVAIGLFGVFLLSACGGGGGGGGDGGDDGDAVDLGGAIAVDASLSCAPW